MTVPIASTNPATGLTWRRYEAHTPAQVDERLGLASRAYAAHRRTSFEQRAAWLEKVAELLELRVEELAALAAREMGKTVAAGRAEVLKCAKGCRYYAENAQAFLAGEWVDGASVSATRAHVRWEPLGAILAVMPWNYPFWQVLRFAAPTITAGNVAVLKHAPNVPGCALALERLFLDAGLPVGMFQTVLVGAREVDAIIADPRIAAVTLTGSESAGRSVAASAGAALKKAVLELGGSDPFVVLPSADVAEAAGVGVLSRYQNAGQSCIAAKRFIVHEDCFDEFVGAFVQGAKSLRVGDPSAEETEMGPLATPTSAAGLRELVDDAVEHGAKVACGGRAAPGPGWFFEPTVLRGVTPRMRIYREETFGPVAAVIAVRSISEAVAVANATDFGLGANVWSSDPAEQRELIEGIEAGGVFVNGMTASYPALPFGGIKSSGYGRELAALGIREFCNAKTVWEA
jgi:succinate-semialdehyde dehydrogenase/glutarate-semialdehyde dehydrogenase